MFVFHAWKTSMLVLINLIVFVMCILYSSDSPHKIERITYLILEITSIDGINKIQNICNINVIV